MDHLGEVVFQEALALGLEERDQLLVVGGVGGDQAEIDLLAALIDGYALQALGDRAVLLRREGLGIEDLQIDLAVGDRGVFLQRLAHALGVDAIGRDLVAQALGVIEAQRDRLLDRRQRLPRAIGEGIEVRRGQVDPRRAQAMIRDHVDGDEDHRGGGEAQERDGAAGEQGCLHRGIRLNPLS